MSLVNIRFWDRKLANVADSTKPGQWRPWEGEASLGEDHAYGVLADGTAVTVLMAGAPVRSVIWVSPNPGDTVAVSYKTSANSPAQAWPPGPVGAYSESLVVGRMYSVTFQRTGGASALSAYGVAK